MDNVESFNEKAFSALVSLNNAGNRLSLAKEPGRFTVSDTYDRLKQLPELCQQSLLNVSGDNGYAFNADRDLDIFWDTLNEYYVDFTRVNANWVDTYNFNKLTISKAKNTLDVFNVLSEMASLLSDGHVNVFWGPMDRTKGGAEGLYDREDFQTLFDQDQADLNNYFLKSLFEDKLATEYLDVNNITALTHQVEFDASAKYVEAERKKAKDITASYADTNVALPVRGNGQIHSFNTKDNIGYIRIDSMTGFSTSDEDDEIRVFGAAFDEAINDLKDADSMIVDVRENTGGDPEIALQAIARFVSEIRYVYSEQSRLGNVRAPLLEMYVEPRGPRQFTKPVVVLISDGAFSAAETFALAMRLLPNVRLVGMPSGGGFSNRVFARVTSNIGFSYSHQFVLSVDGEWFEKQGVPVNKKVSYATQTERRLKKDLGLESAINLLTM